MDVRAMVSEIEVEALGCSASAEAHNGATQVEACAFIDGDMPSGHQPPDTEEV